MKQTWKLICRLPEESLDIYEVMKDKTLFWNRNYDGTISFYKYKMEEDTYKDADYLAKLYFGCD